MCDYGDETETFVIQSRREVFIVLCLTVICNIPGVIHLYSTGSGLKSRRALSKSTKLTVLMGRYQLLHSMGGCPKEPKTTSTLIGYSVPLKQGSPDATPIIKTMTHC